MRIKLISKWSAKSFLDYEVLILLKNHQHIFIRVCPDRWAMDQCPEIWWWIRGFIYFPRVLISPNVNAMARLEFELAYYDVIVPHVSHCTGEQTLLSSNVQVQNQFLILHSNYYEKKKESSYRFGGYINRCCFWGDLSCLVINKIWNSYHHLYFIYIWNKTIF